MVVRSLGAAILALGCASGALAQNADDLGRLAGAFGAREAIQQISISPSGNRVAYIGPDGDKDMVLFVAEIDGAEPPKPILRAGEKKTSLSWCKWARDDRLVCKADIVKDDSGFLLSYGRVFALDADGGNTKLLTPSNQLRGENSRQFGGAVVSLDVAGEPDKVMMALIGAKRGSGQAGLALKKVDIYSGKSKIAETAQVNAVAYITDENGHARMLIRRPHDVHGNIGNREINYFRLPGTEKWVELNRTKVDMQSASGFSPVAVDSKRNIALGFDDADGYQGLYSVKLDGSGEEKLVLGRDDVDVDSLLRIGRNRRVIGASYATEKRQVAYFDKELGLLAASLRKALPGQPLIGILDASADESRLLIIASSDTDPGMIYLFDKKAGSLSPLFAVRDYLDGIKMGHMKPISFTASDGTEIPGYLTLPPQSSGKNLPMIVMPHGGPGARDEWGFDWLVQFFVARGYGVLQPNFRGSAGYGRAWFGRNGFKAWKTAIGDVDDAGRWLVAQGIADPAKMAIVGWSYGGYAALQSQVLDPDLYKAVVAIAPVTDLDKLREASRDYTDFALVNRFIGNGPHVKAGSPAKHAQAFKAPVILFHGDLDQNVPVAQSREMKSALQSQGKRVEYVEFKGLDHYLDSHQARAKMLYKIDRFLAQSLGR